MRLLLDTHIFLWYIADRKRVPTAWIALLRDPQNQVFLSVVSFWEIIIKYQTGKLPLPEAPEVYVPSMRTKHRISSLSIDEFDVAYVAQLPSIHGDPFDRLLVAQALRHGLTILDCGRACTRVSQTLVSVTRASYKTPASNSPQPGPAAGACGQLNANTAVLLGSYGLTVSHFLVSADFAMVSSRTLLR